MSKTIRTPAQLASDKRFSKFRQTEIEDQLMAIAEEANDMERQLKDIDLKYRCTCDGGNDQCDNTYNEYSIPIFGDTS